MDKLRRLDRFSIVISVCILLICTFVIGELHGFAFGYDGALAVENPGREEITVAVHGYSYLAPIYWGYVVCWFSCSAYIALLLGKQSYVSIQTIILGIAISALGRGLYFKFIVINRTGDISFINPYEKLIGQAVILDGLCLIAQIGLLILLIRNWRFKKPIAD